jgi:hypothetical protein
MSLSAKTGRRFAGQARFDSEATSAANEKDERWVEVHFAQQLVYRHQTLLGWVRFVEQARFD